MKRRMVHALLAGLSAVMAVVVGLLTNLATDEPRLVVAVALVAGAVAWAGLEFVRSWRESPPGWHSDQVHAPGIADGRDVPPVAADVSRGTGDAVLATTASVPAATPGLGPDGPAGSAPDGSTAVGYTRDRVTPDEPAQPPPRGVAQWKKHANVDHDSEGYFGREQITERLAHELVNRRPGIVTLQGVGGVGKTTTAYEAVSQVHRDGAFGAILWTKVRDDLWQRRDGPARKSWADAVSDLASQLGVELDRSDAGWDDALRNAIKDPRRDDRVLTVLDNLEIDTVMQNFTELLHGLGFADPPHKLLVTSRAVAPQAWIQPYQLNGLDHKAALDLIGYLGADDERLAAAEAALFDPILDAVEGNPLLIKIVVRRFISGNRSLEEIVEELPSGRLPEDTTVGDYLFRQQLEELVRRSGAEAVDLMYAFREGRRGEEFTADQLMEMSALDEEQFRRVLDSGRDLGLIGGGKTNVRYSIHSVLHDVLRRRLPNVSGEE